MVMFNAFIYPKSLENKLKMVNKLNNIEIEKCREKIIININGINIYFMLNNTGFFFIGTNSIRIKNKILSKLENLFKSMFDECLYSFTPFVNSEYELLCNIAEKCECYTSNYGDTNVFKKYRDGVLEDSDFFRYAVITLKNGISFEYYGRTFSCDEENIDFMLNFYSNYFRYLDKKYYE